MVVKSALKADLLGQRKHTFNSFPIAAEEQLSFDFFQKSCQWLKTILPTATVQVLGN